jgi:hypothetical protein
MTYHRRSFIRNAALYSASAVLWPACKTLSKGAGTEQSFLQAKEIDASVPKRVNWNALPDADKKAFIDAVSAMKASEIVIPEGFGYSGGKTMDRWAAQAQVHEFHCSHRDWFFLPWHRSYLYHFELYLRKQIRDSFRIPYWDWSSTGSLDQECPKELQPAELLSRLAISRNTNSIVEYPSTAPEGENDEQRMAREDQERQTSYSKKWWEDSFAQVLLQNDFDSIGGDEGSSGLIESPYHNMVHAIIGGTLGLVSSAANDPIFWLHHCNVDRLWSIWMDRLILANNTRQMFPSTNVGAWLDQTFPNHFFMPDGTLTSATVRTSLFTEDLGYNYDSMRMTWTLTDIPQDQPTTEVPAPVDYVDTTAPAGLRLNATPGSSLVLQFSVPALKPRSQRVLSMRLKLSGLQAPRNNRLNYAVSLQIGKRVLPLPPIGFFTGAHEGHEGAIGISLQRHIGLLQSLAQSSIKAQLILTLQDQKGEAVIIKDAVPNFSADPARYGLSLKVVYGV